MAQSRFILQLLEPGEIYFEDFSVSCDVDGYHFEGPRPVAPRGRFRVCSKSIFFEPAESKFPLLRVNLTHCLKVTLIDRQTICIDCTQLTSMLKDSIIAPYKTHKGAVSFTFTFHYANCDECFQRVSQLHRAASLPHQEQQTMISTIVYSRHSRVKFDPCWFEDLREATILEARAIQISPLVTNPGRIILTTYRLYFQPYNGEPWPVLKLRVGDIDRIVRRRYLLQNSAVELYCKESCLTQHLFLALENQTQCEVFLHKLQTRRKEYGHEETHPNLDIATLQWQHGVISNYDYLLLLNSLADRSFNDLIQYPVFPWVVQDYHSAQLDLDKAETYRDLSKPVGALNPHRLKQLTERFREMHEPRFLYGSHYMAPGFVLFYLARQLPQLVLCLHGGKFDHPDRMFNSIPQTWNNVYAGASDYKELVPEFYGSQGEFLVNFKGINFGQKSDGTSVSDVQLPPWASTPQEFTSKLRLALESEHASRNIHKWIDLIFGYLQRGQAAVEANNLFHPLCYEGSVDLTSVWDPAQRHMYEIQILEFGQIPRQLFTKPHPPRVAGLVENPLPLWTPDEDLFRARSWSQGRLADLQMDAVFQGHKRSVRGLAFSSDYSISYSIALDGFLKAYRFNEGKQCLSVSAVSGSPITALLALPNTKWIVLGTAQNSVALYQLDCCRLEDLVYVHEDSVTCLSAVENGVDFLIASGSEDCSAKVWRCRRVGEDDFRFRFPADIVAEFEHVAPVTAIDFSADGKFLSSGTREGEITVWEFASRQPLHRFQSHSREVSGLKFSPDGRKLVSCGKDGILHVIRINQDSSFAVTRADTGEDLRCLSWDGLSVLLGSASGELLLFDLVQVGVVKRINAHTGSLNAIVVSSAGDVVITAGDDARVCVWKPKPHPS